MKFKYRSKFKFPQITKTIFFLSVGTLVTLSGMGILVYNTLPSIPDKIPFFYTLPWGITQLEDKRYLWVLVALGIVVFLVNFVLAMIEEKKNNYAISDLYIYSGFILNILLLYYTYRIISISAITDLSTPPWVKLIVIPIILAFLITVIIIPFVIKFARKYNFMDDPLRHNHPGMLLTKPTPRAGGLAFFLGVFIPSLLIIPVTQSQKFLGIFLGALICVLVGLRDDRKDVNPYIRATLQIVAVLIAVLSGIILIYIPNPFGDAIKLDDFKYVIEYFGTHKVYYISVIAATVWMLLMMNFLSFANGSDGVYAGLITIAALVIAILMLNSLETDPGLDIFVKLSSLIVGAGLAMAAFTWPPQKILWGYGATAAGLMIAALSIIGSTKVATTIIVLMIPFLDGVFAVIRRLSRGQMPLWGDREHLHHKLLEDLNWSKQKVAIFYWGTTIVFASIGIATSGQARAISLASLTLLVVLGIAFLNIFKSPKKKNLSE